MNRVDELALIEAFADVKRVPTAYSAPTKQGELSQKEERLRFLRTAIPSTDPYRSKAGRRGAWRQWNG